jgi:hypothetical protein
MKRFASRAMTLILAGWLMAAALDAYERTLKEAPARFNALAGAARASRTTGDSGKARFYYATLMRCCSPVARRKELDEARVFISGDESIRDQDSRVVRAVCDQAARW